MGLGVDVEYAIANGRIAVTRPAPPIRAAMPSTMLPRWSRAIFENAIYRVFIPDDIGPSSR
jgi:hypothetical protein